MIQVGIGAVVGFVIGAAVSSRPTSKSKNDFSTTKILPAVSKEKFAKFVSLMACSPTGFKAPSGKLGAFQISPKRLQDLSIVSATTRQNTESGPIWISIWRHPFTEESFLSRPKVQYAAFLKSCQKYLPITDAYKGKIVDGKPLSVSGILGVLHVAGESGFNTWVSEPKIRKKFTNTTSTFNQTNGVF